MSEALKISSISKEKLISLQKICAVITGIPFYILDPDSNFILEPVYTSESANAVLITEKGMKKCKQEISRMVEEVKTTRKVYLKNCYSGLFIFGIPVFYQDNLFAVCVGCHLMNAGLSREHWIALSKELGIEDADSFLRHNEKLPVYSEERLKEIADSLGDMINIFISDELELVNISKEIVNNYTEISLLYEIGEIFSRGLGILESCNPVIDLIANLMDVQRISLMLIDEDSGELKIILGRGISEDVIKNTRVKLGEGISGFVAKTGKPMLVENIDESPQIKNMLVGQSSYKSQSFISAPLICSPLKVENKVIGVINLSEKKSKKSFTKQELNILSAMGTQIAALIENRRHFNDTRELFISTIRSLSQALDAKDHYTFGHAQEVTECSLVIANELNLSDQERADIELGSILHDIGKIAIPEKILLKPGKLTDEEFTEIKNHPVRGAEMLSGIKQLQNVIPGILYHHERFDGTGYPKGLKGDEIPLIAKILAVADSYNAMTSERSYRAAFTRQMAMEEIKRNAGTQFDPLVTQAFLWAFAKDKI